jgi:hypothetical protein
MEQGNTICPRPFYGKGIKKKNNNNTEHSDLHWHLRRELSLSPVDFHFHLTLKASAMIKNNTFIHMLV